MNIGHAHPATNADVKAIGVSNHRISSKRRRRHATATTDAILSFISCPQFETQSRLMHDLIPCLDGIVLGSKVIPEDKKLSASLNSPRRMSLRT